MAVTQKEIAAKLGVSQTLVGVALSGKGRIGAELKAQILEEAQRLGYKPNRIARALKSGRSQLVALWLPRPLGDFDTQILETLQERAALDGFHLLTALSPRFGEVNDEVLNELPIGEWPLDGVLALDSSPRLSAAIQVLAEARPDLPLVALGHRALLNQPAWDAVGVDLYSAAQSAVRHLVAQGCKSLMFVGAKSLFSEIEPRLNAFRAVCDEAGIKGQELVIPDSPTLRRVTQSHFEPLLPMLHGDSLPLGVLAGNDDVALGVMRALTRHGFSVPEQIRVIGCDDIPDSADSNPPLSTIELPVEALVTAAWTLFKHRLEDRDAPPHHQNLSARLLLRQSA